MKFLHSRPAESWTLSLGQFYFKKISSFLHRCCYFLFIAIEWMTRILTSTHELINVIDFAFKSNLINCLKNYARHYGSQEKIAKCETNKKSWQYKSNDSETERWRKINNHRRHQRHAETHNKEQTHRCQTFFFWLWFLCACAHARGDQKRNSHFNSNAWIPFHKCPQFTQLIYIYRFGMLLVLLIYNIRSYVPFYSILCSLSFAHLNIRSHLNTP